MDNGISEDCGGARTPLRSISYCVTGPHFHNMVVCLRRMKMNIDLSPAQAKGGGMPKDTRLLGVIFSMPQHQRDPKGAKGDAGTGDSLVSRPLLNMLRRAELRDELQGQAVADLEQRFEASLLTDDCAGIRELARLEGRLALRANARRQPIVPSEREGKRCNAGRKTQIFCGTGHCGGFWRSARGKWTGERRVGKSEEGAAHVLEAVGTDGVQREEASDVAPRCGAVERHQLGVQHRCDGVLEGEAACVSEGCATCSRRRRGGCTCR